MDPQKADRIAGCLGPLLATLIFVGLPIGWLMWQVQSCEDQAEAKRAAQAAIETPQFEAARDRLEKNPPETLGEATEIIGKDPLTCFEESEYCSWPYTTHSGSRYIEVVAQPFGVPPKLRNGSPVRRVRYR